MPNWCNTSISFEVHDESQICMDALKDFYYKIKNQLDWEQVLEKMDLEVLG